MSETRVVGCRGCDTTAGALGCPIHGGPTTYYTGAVRRTPHTCPVCTGQGKVSRPPWVAGDQPTWVSGNLELYECQACGGTGIVWEASHVE